MPGSIKSFKSKLLGVLSLGAIAATNAAAAGITMGADGSITGSFDLANVYVVGAAVFGAIATIAVISISIRMLRKAG